MTNKKLYEAVRTLHEEVLIRVNKLEDYIGTLADNNAANLHEVKAHCSVLNARTAAMADAIDKLTPKEVQDIPAEAVEAPELFEEEKATFVEAEAPKETEIVERKAVLGDNHTYRHKVTKNSQHPTLVYLKHVSTHLRDYRGISYTAGQLKDICEGSGIEVCNAATERSRANGRDFVAAVNEKDVDRLIEVCATGKWK